MRTLRIRVGTMEATATLNDSRTADAIWEAAPFQAAANTWGDEIYFTIPVSLGPDGGKEVVDAGDLGYWPVGKAFCIFWGPTPASQGNEIRPASPVNVFGRLDGDPRVFDGADAGASVLVERVE